MSLQIRLDELANGPIQRAEKLPTDWCEERLGAGFAPTDAGFEVKFRASASGSVVEVRCSVSGDLSLGCSRCGDGIVMPVTTDFEHRFVPAGKLDAGIIDPDEELFTADPDVSEHDGMQVDLQPLCIEYAILAVPYAPSCNDRAEGPCESWSEEPARFGDEFPEDEEEESPWAALSKIKLAPGPDEAGKDGAAEN